MYTIANLICAFCFTYLASFLLQFITSNLWIHMFLSPIFFVCFVWLIHVWVSKYVNSMVRFVFGDFYF